MDDRMHPYLYNTPQDTREMLQAIGVASLDELFQCVPSELQLKRPLDLPPALTELELTSHLQSLAGRNTSADNSVCFLGGGAYDHFIPAVVDAIAGRAEFYTSYTPYQPEVSQGNLQAMFEYQSLICELTGMDVSNASLYDGGTAVVEAALLCLAATRRRRVVVSGGVNPEHLQILETYLRGIDAEATVAPMADGVTDLEGLAAAIGDAGDAACVLLQQPNFFGRLEPVADAARIAHQSGAMLGLSFDPLSLGVLRRPGDLGADVAVAEGQSLGNPLQFGGPYLGLMACRESLVRRLPGRLAGETKDRRDKRCWVLTLQTREQHIQRERATSNICTNQGLLALRAAVYLSLLGPQGLREVGELSVQKAHYAADQLPAAGLELAHDQPFFKEFVVRDPERRVAQRLATARERGVLAGIPLSRWWPDREDCFLVAVTEKRTRQEIDHWAAALAAAPTEAPLHA